MLSLSRRGLLAAVSGLALLAVALPAWGAATSNSEFVIVREDDVLPEDLYAGAIRVVVEGTIEGDLIAFAAEEIVVNGTVTGSVTAVSPRVSVHGEVGGSLRVFGNSLTVTGSVGRDVVAPVISVDLAESSEVSGDVLLWAWTVSSLGTIGADLTGTQRHLELGGEIGGDVDVSVSTLTIVEPLVVDGDLGYRSDNDADGLDLATVEGAVVHKAPLPPNLRVRALTLLGRFMVIVFLTVAALTTAYGWPRRTSRAIEEVGHKPLRRWLRGALVVFSPLIAIAITALIVGFAPAAASFPLLVVLIPVVLALFGLVAALGLVAGTPVVGWLGGVMFKRFDLYGAILSGAALVGIVWYLPWIGLVVPLLVLPLGLGAWMAAFGQSDSPTSVSVGDASGSK